MYAQFSTRLSILYIERVKRGPSPNQSSTAASKATKAWEEQCCLGKRAWSQNHEGGFTRLVMMQDVNFSQRWCWSRYGLLIFEYERKAFCGPSGGGHYLRLETEGMWHK